MTTIKSYTDIEQSKKLAETLPIESADMCYIAHMEILNIHEPFYKKRNKGDIPCWSLAALIDILPDKSEDDHFLTLQKEKDEYCCCYEDINGDSFTHTFADNPVDACVAMIEYLHGLKIL